MFYLLFAVIGLPIHFIMHAYAIGSTAYWKLAVNGKISQGGDLELSD